MTPDKAKLTLCLETLPAHLMGGLPGGGKRLHKDKQDINVFYSQGSFAEYVVVHESSAIKVRPDAPPDVVCLLSCRITTGVGSVVNRAGVRAGESVVIFGCGAVGLGAVIGAKLCGAGQIIAVDMVDDRLEMAKQLGTKYTINASLENPQQKVMEKVALVACMHKLLTILNAMMHTMTIWQPETIIRGVSVKA